MVGRPSEAPLFSGTDRVGNILTRSLLNVALEASRLR